MDLLVFLAQHRGEVMSKEAIADAVWRREFVSDGTLSHAIAQLRHALGDDTKSPSYIETIPTRGYRLIAPAEQVGTNPARSGGSSGGLTLRRWRVAALAGGGLAVTAVAVLSLVVMATERRRPAETAGKLHGGRLAVLPFDNLGPTERAYLASGVTDDLTSRLASVPGLPVISRLSALSVDRSGRSAREIGVELGVDFLLAGTVRWALDPSGQGLIRVNAQLVRAADDTHLWGESYGCSVAQLVKVEADIAERVLDEIGIEVGEPLRRRLGDRPTLSADAYEAYLSGMRHSRFETRAHLGLAVAMFERATEIDSSFALAWAQLGAVRARLHSLRFDVGGEGLAQARAAIEQALALDAGLPEAQRALGAYLLFGERDYAGALDALRRAATGLPNDSELKVLIADVHRRQGHWNEAREQLEACYASDPRSYTVALALADTLSLLRRYGAADIAYRRAESVMPDDPEPYLQRARNTLRWAGQGERCFEAIAEVPRVADPAVVFSRFLCSYVRRDFDAALAELRRTGGYAVTTPTMRAPVELLECLTLSSAGREGEAATRCAAALAAIEATPVATQEPGRHIARGYALALLGRYQEAVEEAQRVVGLCPVEKDAVVGAACLGEAARIHALSGSVAAAVDALEVLLEVPSRESTVWLRADPRFDRIRGDARFAVLVAARTAP